MIYYSKNHWYMIFSYYYKLVRKVWPMIVAIIVPSLAYGIKLSWLIMILIGILTFLKWNNEYIIVNGEYLIYKKGILEREELIIPLKNISVVEFDRNIVHKILGLSRIKIESISPKDRNFNIIMVFSVDKREKFKKAFNYKKHFSTTENYDVSGQLTYKITKLDLPLLLTLKSNLILGAGIIYTMYSLLNDADEKMSRQLKEIILELIKNKILEGKNLIMVILFTLLIMVIITLIIMLASLFGVISKYYKYKIYRKNNYIYIEYGLVVRKHYSIALNNIHAITLEQNIISQLFNLYTIKCSAVGYGNGYKEEDVLFPLCGERRLRKIFKDLFPEFIVENKIEKPPKRAKNNFYTSWISWASLFALIIFLLTKSPIGLVIVLITFIWRLLVKKNSGLCIDENIIFISCGSFTKRMYFIKKYSLLECNKRVNVFQKRKSICDYKIEFYSKRRLEYIKAKNLEDNLFNELKEKITI